MGRHKKCRVITELPNFLNFKPVGISTESLKKVILTFDEFEALKLSDFEDLYQEQASEKMEVSRQTFGNILKSARKKISEAIVLGRMIEIEGGDITFLDKPCSKCKKNKENCPKK